MIDKDDWEFIDINEYTRDDPPHEHRTSPHRHVLFGCIIKDEFEGDSSERQGHKAWGPNH